MHLVMSPRWATNAVTAGRHVPKRIRALNARVGTMTKRRQLVLVLVLVLVMVQLQQVLVLVLVLLPL